VPHELDDNGLLAAEIRERFLHVSNELLAHIDRFRIEVQRRDQVLYASAASMTINVTQFADGLHAADFQCLRFLLHQDFFERGLLANFVVPDFNLDPSILGASSRRVVACCRSPSQV